MNILYIGSAGPLSLQPFKALLSSGYTIAAAGIYQPVVFRQRIIALENESLALAAQQAAIPVIDLSQPLPSLLSQLDELQIDVLLMACYSRRLPAELVDYPAKGSYNLHPSLLPAYRGPEPVFWQMKQVADSGVSWHRVTEAFDAGDIVAQKKVYLDDGLDYRQINQRLAEVGSELLPALLSAIEYDRLKPVVQDAGAVSYYPYPQAADFVLDTTGSAQQAYNFMRATRAFNQPYRCHYADRGYLLDEALDYDNNRSLEAVEVQGNTLFIPFKTGVLIASMAAKL